MELSDHIRKISFIFFVVLGLGHFVAGLLYVNGYSVNISALINRALFIPFVVSTLTYAASNAIYHRIENGKSARVITYVCIGIGIILLGGFIALEVLVPDASHILLP